MRLSPCVWFCSTPSTRTRNLQPGGFQGLDAMHVGCADLHGILEQALQQAHHGAPSPTVWLSSPKSTASPSNLFQRAGQAADFFSAAVQLVERRLSCFPAPLRWRYCA